MPTLIPVQVDLGRPDVLSSPDTPLEELAPENPIDPDEFYDSDEEFPNQEDQQCWSRGGFNYCFTDSSCLGSVILGKFLAAGGSGTIYETCLGHRCDLVIKMVPLNASIPPQIEKPGVRAFDFVVTTDRFRKEANLTQIASNGGITPKLIKWGICEADSAQGKIDVGYLVSRRWDITLQNYYQLFSQLYSQEKDTIRVLAIATAKKFNSLGYTHFDLSGNNVILNLNPNNTVKKVAFIDFDEVELTADVGIDNVELITYLLDSLEGKS